LSERETPAYVPGDTIVVEIRIGHSMNIDKVYARFCHEDRTHEDSVMFLERAELEHRNEVEGEEIPSQGSHSSLRRSTMRAIIGRGRCW
jgi:hypothetical protein